MTKVLQINPVLEAKELDRVEKLLGEDYSLFMDGAYESQGDAWIPSKPVEVRNQDKIIKEGYGRLVSVIYLEGTKEIAEYMRCQDLLSESMLNDEYAWEYQISEYCYNNDCTWAHWGIYGTDNDILAIAYPYADWPQEVIEYARKNGCLGIESRKEIEDMMKDDGLLT